MPETKKKVEKKSLPSIGTLYNDKDLAVRQNTLLELLNQAPHQSWIQERAVGGGNKYKYIPIERVEWLMTSIFKTWWCEIKTIQLIGNSAVVTVTVWYQDLISNEWRSTDGVGAQPLQTKKDAGATDWNQLNSLAVQMAAPAAKSYAIKDACEMLGRLFGKDLNRREVAYDNLAKESEKITNLDKTFKPEPQTDSNFIKP